MWPLQNLHDPNIVTYIKMEDLNKPKNQQPLVLKPTILASLFSFLIKKGEHFRFISVLSTYSFNFYSFTNTYANIFLGLLTCLLR